MLIQTLKKLSYVFFSIINHNNDSNKKTSVVITASQVSMKAT